jgi:hypothetical protein
MYRAKQYRLGPRNFLKAEKTASGDPTPGDYYTKPEVDQKLALLHTTLTSEIDDAITPVQTALSTLSDNTTNAITALGNEIGILDTRLDAVESVQTATSSNITALQNQLTSVQSDISSIQDAIDGLTPLPKKMTRTFKGFRLVRDGTPGASHSLYHGMSVLTTQFGSGYTSPPRDGRFIGKKTQEDLIYRGSKVWSVGDHPNYIASYQTWTTGERFVTLNSISPLQSFFKQSTDAISVNSKYSLAYYPPSLPEHNVGPTLFNIDPNQVWYCTVDNVLWQASLHIIDSLDDTRDVVVRIFDAKKFSLTSYRTPRWLVSIISDGGHLPSEEILRAWLDYLLLDKPNDAIENSNIYATKGLDIFTRAYLLAFAFAGSYTNADALVGDYKAELGFMIHQDPMIHQRRTDMSSSFQLPDTTMSLSIVFPFGRRYVPLSLMVVIETKYSDRLAGQLFGVPRDTPLAFIVFSSNVWSSLFQEYVEGVELALPAGLADNAYTITVFPYIEGKPVGDNDRIFGTLPVSIEVIASNTRVGVDYGEIIWRNRVVSAVSDIIDDIGAIDLRLLHLQEEYERISNELTQFGDAFNELTKFVMTLVPVPKPIGLTIADTLFSVAESVLSVVYPPAAFLMKIAQDVTDDIVTKSLSGIQLEDIGLNILGAILCSASMYSANFKILINSITREFTFTRGSLPEEIELQDFTNASYNLETGRLVTIDEAVTSFSYGDETSLGTDPIQRYADIDLPREQLQSALNATFWIEDISRVGPPNQNNSHSIEPSRINVTYIFDAGSVVYDGTKTSIINGSFVGESPGSFIIETNPNPISPSGTSVYVRTRTDDYKITPITSISEPLYNVNNFLCSDVPLVYSWSGAASSSSEATKWTQFFFHDGTTPRAVISLRGNQVILNHHTAAGGYTSQTVITIPQYTSWTLTITPEYSANGSDFSFIINLISNAGTLVRTYTIPNFYWTVTHLTVTLSAVTTTFQNLTPSRQVFTSKSPVRPSLCGKFQDEASTSYDHNYDLLAPISPTMNFTPRANNLAPKLLRFKRTSLMRYSLAGRSVSDFSTSFRNFQLSAPIELPDLNTHIPRFVERMPIDFFSTSRVCAL